MFCAVGLAFAQLAFAQAPDSPPTIATDRPAITDSSAVVSGGGVIVENGWLYTSMQGGRVIDFPESLIRIGFGGGRELRVTIPDYFSGALSQTSAPSGFGDFELGVKQQLAHLPFGFQASAVVSLSFPTGSKAYSSHGYDPSFQLPWSRSLSANWTAAGMLSLYVPTQDGSHTVVGENAILIDRQLTKPWDAFVEYVADIPNAGGTRQLLHFGTSYKLGNSQQLDVHGAVGLSSAAVDHFIGVGYSFMLEKRH